MERCMKMLAMCACVCMCVAPVSATIVLADWQFNNSLDDSSGNGHHLTQVGDPFGFVSSPSGLAIEMSVDASRYVYAGTDVMGTITYDQEVIFDTMIKVTDETRRSAILHREDNNNNQIWWRIEADGKQRFYWRYYKDPSDPSGGGGAALIVMGSAENLNDGQWRRLTAVKSYDPDDGIVVTLFVDGVLDGSGSDNRWVTDFDQFGDARMYVGSFANTDGSDLTGAMEYLTISVIPEPATIVLLGTGLLFAAKRRRA